MTTDDLRKLANTAEVSIHDDWEPTLEFVQSWVNALRQAADRIEALERDAKANMEGWKESIEISRQLLVTRDAALKVVGAARAYIQDENDNKAFLNDLEWDICEALAVFDKLQSGEG